MKKEITNENSLEKIAGGYNAFSNENKFTDKSLSLTEDEFKALDQAGFINKENSDPSIKPERFQEAQEYLNKHGFKGMSNITHSNSESVNINILKWFHLIFYLLLTRSM